MKRAMCIVALGTGVFSASGIASEKNHKAQFTVPFNFSVYRKQMPAGDYKVQDDGRQFVTLRNVRTGESVHVIKAAGSGSERPRSLTFEQTSAGPKLVKIG